MFVLKDIFETGIKEHSLRTFCYDSYDKKFGLYNYEKFL